MVYLNARSVTCNLEKIELICSDLQPELIICTESRITEQIDENEYEIDGYNTVLCMSNSRHTGGLLFYIKKILNIKLLQMNLSTKLYGARQSNSLNALSRDVTQQYIDRQATI